MSTCLHQRVYGVMLERGDLSFWRGLYLNEDEVPFVASQDVWDATFVRVYSFHHEEGGDGLEMLDYPLLEG